MSTVALKTKTWQGVSSPRISVSPFPGAPALTGSPQTRGLRAGASRVLGRPSAQRHRGATATRSRPQKHHLPKQGACTWIGGAKALRGTGAESQPLHSQRQHRNAPRMIDAGDTCSLSHGTNVGAARPARRVVSALDADAAPATRPRPDALT